jgi:NhaP-type Na+/H+ or K+/H+ antiporter
MRTINSIISNNIFRFLLLAVIGLYFSILFKQNNIDLTSIDYTYFTYTLLAMGLYGGVYAINLKDLHSHKKVIISVITTGVILKSVIIGGLLYLVTGNILSFLFGIIVAQIDPISVTYLLQKNKQEKLSKSGETVLRAWSSFDDPMTVLLLLYLALPMVSVFLNGGILSLNLESYFYELFYNLSFALALFILFQFFKEYFKRYKILEIFLLFLIFAGVVYLKLMLAIAIIALFFRPKIEKYIDKSIVLAFYLSTILLGILLINGISLEIGLLLALFTVLSQIISSFILVNHFSKKDKIYLAFGQQNGITSIILSILIEGFYPGTIAIIAPAIFFINSIYYLLNYLADKYFDKANTAE